MQLALPYTIPGLLLVYAYNYSQMIMITYTYYDESYMHIHDWLDVLKVWLERTTVC